MSTMILNRMSAEAAPAPVRQAGARTASEPVRTETATTFAELSAHAAAWDALAAEAPQQIPTLTPVWVEAYLRHALPADAPWLCLFAYAGSRLVGVLPLLVEPHPVLGRRHPVLHTLRVGDFSPSGDILLSADQGAPALRALLAAADRAVPRHLGLALQGVHERSPVWAAIREGLPGYAAHAHARYLYSFVDVTGGAEDYMGGLGNLKRNLKRYRKKLDGSGPVAVSVTTAGPEESEALDAFLALEAAGWKGRNGTAILNDPAITAFYRALAAGFSAQGRWAWQSVRVGDRLVAAGMGIRCGRTVMLPKIAFDEEFSACMPGNLLTEAVARDAFADPETDELAHMSAAPWHESWRMGQHRYDDLRLVRTTVVATLFERPRAAGLAVYKTHVAPRIPARVKAFRERLRNRAVQRAKSGASQSGTADA